MGLETIWTYNPRNWTLSVTTKGTTDYTVSFTYDLVGNKLSETDAHQQTTNYTYDDLNRLSRVLYPEGNEELYLYDQVGNKTRVLDGKGNRTDYSYNAANKLLEVTDAKGQVTRYGYDRLGNQTRTVNALGQEITNSYDELNRLTYSKVEGRFRDRLTSKNGYVTEDFLGALTLDFALSDQEVVPLDYAAASLAADLGEEVGGISRLYFRNSSTSSRIRVSRTALPFVNANR